MRRRFDQTKPLNERKNGPVHKKIQTDEKYVLGDLPNTIRNDLPPAREHNLMPYDHLITDNSFELASTAQKRPVLSANIG